MKEELKNIAGTKSILFGNIVNKKYCQILLWWQQYFSSAVLFKVLLTVMLKVL